MRSIWKYILTPQDVQDVDVPEGAKFIAAGMQGDVLCVWAEVRTQNSVECRRIHVYGTGHPFAGGKHIDTVIDPPFVWHIYEETR